MTESKAAQANAKFEAASLPKVYDDSGQQVRIGDRVEVSILGWPKGVDPDEMPPDFTDARTGQVEDLLSNNKAKVKVDDPYGRDSGNYDGRLLRPL